MVGTSHPTGGLIQLPPQEIAGLNSRPYDQGNQWVFISPDHKGPRLFLRRVRGFGGGPRLTIAMIFGEASTRWEFVISGGLPFVGAYK